jgi:Trp operon repressor
MTINVVNNQTKEGAHMTKNAWLKRMDVRCNAVVESLKDLHTHLDTLEEVLGGLSQDELEDLYALSATKIKRMYRQLRTTGMELKEKATPDPEPEETPVH